MAGWLPNSALANRLEGTPGGNRKGMSKRLRTLLALSPLHAALAVVTWRDLNRRDDAEVRGSKRLWRLASSADPVGSIAYWLVGRKGGHTGPQP